MNSSQPNEKTAIVAGASGIGRATAKKFTASGPHVCILGLDGGQAEDGGFLNLRY